MIYEIQGKRPRIAKTAFVHPSAQIVGDVVIEDHASVWHGAVIRGDLQRITLGENSNVQDNCVLHTNSHEPLVIGANVVVGHGVKLHSCVIDDGALIGIGAIVLDGAHIERGACVAAGTLVPPGKTIPEGHMCMGVPAKVTRALSQEERAYQVYAAEHYIEVKEYFRTGEVLTDCGQPE